MTTVKVPVSIWMYTYPVLSQLGLASTSCEEPGLHISRTVQLEGGASHALRVDVFVIFIAEVHEPMKGEDRMSTDCCYIYVRVKGRLRLKHNVA